MKTPPGLLGLAILFWGWMIGALWIAVPATIVLEASHWLRIRFDFAQNDLDRIWHLCVFLFVGSAVAAFALGDGFDAVGGVFATKNPAERLELFNQSANTAVQFLQYTPATLLPIMLAQAFAQQERFAASTFSAWLRRRRRRQPSQTPTTNPTMPAGLNVTYPFFALTLFAAALSRGQGPWFLVGLSILVVWALWHHRPHGAKLSVWTAALVAAVGLGLAAQLGLIQLQHLFRRLDNALMARLAGNGKGFDPKGVRTRLGTISALKQSGQIVLRVEADGTPPPLLREASYDLFRSPYWGSSRRQFERTLPDILDTSWALLPLAKANAHVTISTYLDGGKGLLPLPTGVARLTDLPVFVLQTNIHGAVQVEEGPGFVRFNARYGEHRTFDAPPTQDDLNIPVEERAAIDKLTTELGLVGQSAVEAIHRIRAHFDRHFEYATARGLEHRANSNSNGTALAAFLLEHRSGHCEYFATATSLLLRAAGIPARYAVGYAVQEKSGRFYLVRCRHAHAWTLAWMDGRWQDVDTTPGNWTSREAQRAGFWEPVYDLFSRLWFEFSKWRWGPTDWKRHLIWLVVPLIGLVGARVVLHKQWRRVPPNQRRGLPDSARPGLDSEFYLLERLLTERGLSRAPHETMQHWLARGEEWLTRLADAHPGSRALRQSLPRLIDLHYRLRFDPQGLDVGERADLQRAAQTWFFLRSRRPPDPSG